MPLSVILRARIPQSTCSLAPAFAGMTEKKGNSHVEEPGDHSRFAREKRGRFPGPGGLCLCFVPDEGVDSSHLEGDGRAVEPARGRTCRPGREEGAEGRVHAHQQRRVLLQLSGDPQARRRVRSDQRPPGPTGSGVHRGALGRGLDHRRR